MLTAQIRGGKLDGIADMRTMKMAGWLIATAAVLSLGEAEPQLTTENGESSLPG